MRSNKRAKSHKNNAGTLDDEQVVTEVLEGDRNAFAVLVKRYHKQVFTLMNRFANSPSDAADLTQDAFTKAYTKLETFHPGKRFFVWLYTLSLNLARDYARKNKKYNDNLVGELNDNYGAIPTQESRVIQQGDSIALSDALNRLPEDFREALILRYKEDFSVKDISRILNLSVSGVKMRIYRGLSKLREIYLEDDHEKDI
jgi:RNA polymerase sigma-70 factor (ECF subfamily)